MLWLNILLFIVGLIMLIKGGDWFVDGATGIARRFHMSELLIGATVVSIGTTLPEVMVSAGAAINGHGEIAYGNAVGSIICNTALVAAITVAVRPTKIERRPLFLPVCFFFGTAAVYLLSAYLGGGFSRTVGILLFCIFLAYMILSLLGNRKAGDGTEAHEKTEDTPPDLRPLWRDLLPLIVGAGVIAYGANLLVDNGTVIAEALGVPEAVIALTFVALGTSLPELVTAITALVKGHGALSLGNIIGANLFNMSLVSSVSAMLSPFTIPSEQTLFGVASSLVLDLPLMAFVMALLTLPALIRGKLSRWQGILLLCFYAAFCVLQFII